MCLKESPGVDSCDYINASFIDVRTITKTLNHVQYVIHTFRDMKKERMHILQHKVMVHSLPTHCSAVLGIHLVQHMYMFLHING